MGFLDVRSLDDRVEMHLCDRLGQTNDGFQLTNSDWNTIRFLTDLLLLAGHSVANIHVLEHVASLVTQSWVDLHLCIAEVLSQEVDIDIRCVLIVLIIHVQVNDMACNSFIDAFLPHVSHDENSVKTRQNRGLEFNLLSGVLEVIVTTLDWICCGEN